MYTLYTHGACRMDGKLSYLTALKQPGVRKQKCFFGLLCKKNERKIKLLADPSYTEPHSPKKSLLVGEFFPYNNIALASSQCKSKTELLALKCSLKLRWVGEDGKRTKGIEKH